MNSDLMNGGLTDSDLVDLARSGDEAAFTAVVMPHRRELHVHCYRMLGSVDDADDAVQETLLAAWRGLGTFQARASMRTWLYRIATNTCLNALRASARRPQQAGPLPAHLPASTPPPSGYAEVTWLQPYPDALLDELPAPGPTPDAIAEQNDQISLAFTCALQLLTPRARAALILRDVLGFTTREAAAVLDCTEEAVATILGRARRAVAAGRGQAGAAGAGAVSTGARDAETARRLAGQLAAALAARDVDAVVRLLADDVRLSMPPTPATWDGRELAAAFLAEAVFSLVPQARFIPVEANRQPALAAYAYDRASGAWRANGVLVITVRGPEITPITRFGAQSLRAFGLPGILAD